MAGALAAALGGGCAWPWIPGRDPAEARRIRAALLDLEQEGFRFREPLRFAWSDPTVLCAPGLVCAGPRRLADGTLAVTLAPRVLRSEVRLRLALLELWQRLEDGPPYDDPASLARGTLRLLVDGARFGADAALLAEIRSAYAGYRSAAPAADRAALPPPERYVPEAGAFADAEVPLRSPTGALLPDDRYPGPRALGTLELVECPGEREDRARVDLPGGNGRAAFWDGVCAWQAGDLDRAGEAFERAAALLPYDPRAPLWLGQLRCAKGEVRQGLRALARARALALDPAIRADALRATASCLEEVDPARARALYREAERLDPDPVAAGWAERPWPGAAAAGGRGGVVGRGRAPVRAEAGARADARERRGRQRFERRALRRW